MDGGTKIEPVCLRKVDSVVDAVGWAMCGLYGLTPGELMSHRRDRHLSWPRQELYYYTYNLTNAGRDILSRVLRRDKKTLFHGIKRAQERMSKEAQSA